ncbi:MAG: hypothetical protein NTX76_04815 [Alphaproteobacteria bacterium]|nr:hypothetical protein [Alphaproteobacteria bacterium]
MDWFQTLTIIFTLAGMTYAFHRDTKENIKRLDEDMKNNRVEFRASMERMDAVHREDVRRSEDRWAELDRRLDERLARSEERWNRLDEKWARTEEKWTKTEEKWTNYILSKAGYKETVQ